jgi:hypothetical protein
MWRARIMLQHRTCFSLETQAASARLALGCAYSSSEEYEAAVITARRAAGAYCSWHPQREVAMAAAVTAAALLLVIAM